MLTDLSIRDDAIQLAEAEKVSFTPEDKASAFDKLRKAAVEYAVDSAPFIAPLQVFKGLPQLPQSFRDNFYRIFLIKFTLPEIGALMTVFDPFAAGTVDGPLFLKAFMRLGSCANFCYFRDH